MGNVSKQAIGWVRFWTPRDDWYYLEPSERATYLQEFAKVTARFTERGARLIGTYKCRGQSAWARFEIWEFPALQMLIDMSNELEEIGHFQYFAEDHTVGRRYDRVGSTESWVI